MPGVLWQLQDCQHQQVSKLTADVRDAYSCHGD